MLVSDTEEGWGVRRMTYRPDSTDVLLISRMRANPRATITTLSRLTGLARATVQARLRRLEAERVITGYGPDLDPAASGYGVVAFTTLSIVQGHHDDVVERLAQIPEVLEVHVVTGSGDLLCRVGAQGNDHLHELLQVIVAMPEVGRAETQLALSTPVSRSIADLVAAGAAANAG